MTFSWTDIPLKQFVEETAAVHRGASEAKGLTFDLVMGEGLPPLINTDPTRLRQILNNLLNNATKFTAQGSIKLTVSHLDNEIEFAVSDTGPGIAPECREIIFEKFKQLENFLTREHGGTGLGLAVVKQLTELMGGRVSLKSELGVGSTFSAHFPVGSKHD
jgi:signal transduction histidine kinase